MAQSGQSGADLGDWLQFAGALLAALIAVALWLMERHRQKEDADRTHAAQRRDFRAVVRYAVDDLAKQINYISGSFSSYIGDYENFQNIDPKTLPPLEAAFMSMIKSRAGEMSLEIPRILEFSLEHARFLAPSENSELAEVLSASRGLNSRLWEVVSTDSMPKAGQELYVVADAANLLYRDVEILRAALEDSRGGAGRALSESPKRPDEAA